MDLIAEQARIYALIGGFVRLDRCDDALWVSDLPRRTGETSTAEAALKTIGIRCRLDEKSGMWHLDWTEEKWDALLTGLSAECPAIPRDPAMHPFYAFCRFALAHPAPRSQASLRMARALIKQTQPVRALHEQAVQALRTGNPIAFEAGLLAADILSGEEKR